MDPMNPGSGQELDEALLGRAVLALELADEFASLCKLMKWWSSHARPPLEARLAEARAWLGIKQMDRAWHILRELESLHPQKVEVRLLTVRMFLERGWLARASRMLDEMKGLAQDDPRMLLLRERLEDPEPELPANARELSRTGTALERLRLARQFLVSGSQVRARTLLEGLQKERYRLVVVDQLLWGIRGGDLDSDHTMGQVLQDLLGWTDLDSESAEVTDVGIATELSELDPDTAEGVISGSLQRGQSGPRFPDLFRSLKSPLGTDTEDEQTQASILASLDDLQDPPTEEASIGGSDTQIMEVISSGDGVQIRRLADLDEERSASQVREIESLARKTAAVADASDPLDEDEDVVVMTERVESGEEPTGPTARRRPIQVFEKFPEPAVNADVPSTLETIEIPAVEGRLEEPTLEMDTVDAEDGADRFVRKRRGNRLIVMVFPFLLLALGAGVWWILQLREVRSSEEMLSKTRTVVATGDHAEMQILASRLSSEVQSGAEPVGARAVELALIELFLSYCYTGDAQGMARARAAGKVARDHEAPLEAMALFEASLAWTEGDLDGAQERLGAAGEGVLQDRLQRHIELERSSSDVDSYSEDPVWLAYQAIQGVGTVEKGALKRARESLGTLALRRLESNLMVAMAREAVVSGTGGEDEAERALELDPRNPEALLLDGEFAWTEGSLERARRSFSNCLTVRPADSRCLRGLIVTFGEMDRVIQARELVDGWTGTGPIAPDILDWLAFAEGTSAEEREALGLAGDRLLIASALRRLQIGDPVEAEPEGEAAAARLARGNSVMERRLVERYRSLIRMNAGDQLSEDEVDWEEPDDPWVLLEMARQAMERGDEEEVRDTMDAMARQSRRSARLLYERASLLEGQDRDRALEIWQRYLDLDPSGERAQGIRSMGL